MTSLLESAASRASSLAPASWRRFFRRQSGVAEKPWADDLCVVDLQWWHLRQLGRMDLKPQLGQYAFAALESGRCFAAGGIVTASWDWIGYAWFVQDGSVNPRWWPGITRAVAKAVEIALDGPYCRVEMFVDPADMAAQRWATRLGFKLEGRCASLLGPGKDGLIYGRTRPEPDRAE